MDRKRGSPFLSPVLKMPPSPLSSLRSSIPHPSISSRGFLPSQFPPSPRPPRSLPPPMVLMAAAADDDHARHHLTHPASPPSGPLAPAPHPHPHRRRLHGFSFPTLSWGTHRLLRCAKDPASSPPPAAPDTPSPDKENDRPPADAADAAAPQRPWNLRTRRSATPAPRPDDEDAAADAAPRHPEEPGGSGKRGFSVLLSKEEIADDFALFRGTRPPRRPRKRPRAVQRQIDSLCPGFCLADVTPETYKIEER